MSNNQRNQREGQSGQTGQSQQNKQPQQMFGRPTLAQQSSNAASAMAGNITMQQRQQKEAQAQAQHHYQIQQNAYGLNLEQIQHAQQQQAAAQQAVGEQALNEAQEREALAQLVRELGEDRLNSLSAEQLRGLVRARTEGGEQQETANQARPGAEELQYLQLGEHSYQQMQMGQPALRELEQVRQLQALQGLHPDDISRVAGQLGGLEGIGGMDGQYQRMQQESGKLNQGVLASHQRNQIQQMHHSGPKNQQHDLHNRMMLYQKMTQRDGDGQLRGNSEADQEAHNLRMIQEELAALQHQLHFQPHQSAGSAENPEAKLREMMAARGIDLATLEAGIDINDLEDQTPLQKQLMQMQQEMGGQQLTAHELYQIELLKQNPNMTVEEMQQILEGEQIAAADWQLMAERGMLHQMPQGNMIAGADEARLHHQAQAAAEMPPGAEGVLSSRDSDRESCNSNDTEQQKAKEKQRDQYFEQQLRIFYKNMLERLNNNALEKISKKSRSFCEQLNKVQNDFIQKKKSKKMQDPEVKAESQSNQSKSEEEAREPEDNDADSSFYSLLYGPNSSLNPDPFIMEVLSTLSSHSDLKKQFKRFLPEDDEEEINNMQAKVQSLRANFNISDQEHATGGEAIEASHDEAAVINQRKRESYQNLFKLLEQYREVKDQSLLETSAAGGKTAAASKKRTQNQEQLKSLGEKIMAIAESYQKYVTEDLQNKILQNPASDSNYVDQLESQMSLILSLIPPEVIENYSVTVNAEPSPKATNKKTLRSQRKAQPGRPRRGGLGQSAAKSVEASSASEPEEEVQESEQAGEDDQVQSSRHSDEAEDGEEESQEIDEQSEVAVTEKQPSEEATPEGSAAEEEGEEEPEEEVTTPIQTQRLKSLVTELSQAFPNQCKDLNKVEIKIFDSLHKQIRIESDWQDFAKIFLLYLEGIISLSDFFKLFDEKFGFKLKQDLKNEIEQLLPTREHSRRLKSDILRPWNDLENQKFEKIQDSSYYKIEDDFPLPICTAKLNPSHGPFYAKFLNENYLSLSMGSENFKFKIRNINEDMIFKNEDEMYKLDTQIEMFEKCQGIIEKEIKIFDELSEKNKGLKEKVKYEFPRHKFRPLMYYWEKKYKDALIPFLMHKPFQRDFLISLRAGLGGKLQELQNQKFDQLSTFEDIYRKNFIKSLDHRSFQYKDFIKKIQQKQQHMQEIKQVAQNNQCGKLRSQNLMIGGNCDASPYYHSFGQFIQHDFGKFDPVQTTEDFPIDMRYSNLPKLSQLYPEKFPHLRLVFKDEESKKIAIKILCLHIRYSAVHHNNDRPRLTENMRQILENFMDISEFKWLNQTCGHGRVESLSLSQIDLIMNQNNHLYYLDRLKSEEGPSQQIKIQIQDVERTERNCGARAKTGQSEAEGTPAKLGPGKEDVSDLQIQQSASRQSAEVMSSGQISSPQIPSSPQKLDSAKLPQHYDKMNLKAAVGQTEAQQVQEALFLPHFQSSTSDLSHSLLYAPSNVFMFLKFFYAIYERVLKAKDLIYEKINQDLAEMSFQEKVAAGICHEGSRSNPSEFKPIKEEVMEIFFKERYEFLLKGIFATSTQQSTSSIIGMSSNMPGVYSHNHHLMDHNKYEDYARQLLGKNAFLLFQIDKIISQAIKQLQQMHSDHACQKAMKLFQTYKDDRDTTVLNDRVYLSSYAEQIVDQLSLKDAQNEASSGATGGCGHAAAKFNQGAHGIDVERHQQLKAEASSIAAGGPQLSTSAAATQQANFQVFRLMWSKKSQVMAIHYLNLNPYQIQTQGYKCYKKVMSENYELLKQSTVGALPSAETEPETPECCCKVNRVGDDCQPPVFLKRNLKQMMKFRERKSMWKNSSTTNGLSQRILPHINAIAYEPCATGEDTFHYRKSGLSEAKKLHAQRDMQNQSSQQRIQNKRLKTIGPN